MINATLNLTCFNQKANCFFNSAAVLIHASGYAEVVYLIICRGQNAERRGIPKKGRRRNANGRERVSDVTVLSIIQSEFTGKRY
jgi:hypothetical protein